jgi:cellulose synthase/poly-beta-1,6-N-acetylglucosamine synthase-like glycosyltransferase
MNASDVYVIDDGSTDETAALARRLGVQVMRNGKNLGKASSIQKLVGCFELVERYGYVSLIDADTSVHPDYFRNILAAFSANPDAALVCGQVSSIPSNWATAGRAFDYMFSQSVHKQGQSRLGVILVAPGCASTWRSDVFVQLECDPRMLTEDMDMTVQIHRRGLGEIIYEPSAIAYTQDPHTLSGYVRQSYRWYFGLWQVLRKHSLPFGFRRLDFEVALLALEGLIFSVFLLSLPLLLFSSPDVFLQALMVDQLLMAVFAIYFAARLRRRDVVLYFPSFLLLRYASAFVFTWTFVRVIICKVGRPQWFSPARY